MSSPTRGLSSVQPEPVFWTILIQNWLFWRKAHGFQVCNHTSVISPFLFLALLSIKLVCQKGWVQLCRPGMKNEEVSFQTTQDVLRCPFPTHRDHCVPVVCCLLGVRSDESSRQDRKAGGFLSHCWWWGNSSWEASFWALFDFWGQSLTAALRWERAAKRRRTKIKKCRGVLQRVVFP